MSALQEAVRDYLELRRSLGFKLVDAGLMLPRFIDFLEQRGSSFITTALALEWAQQPTSVQPAEWARRLGVVRCFARYRYASDVLTENGSMTGGRPCNRASRKPTSRVESRRLRGGIDLQGWARSGKGLMHRQCARA